MEKEKLLSALGWYTGLALYCRTGVGVRGMAFVSNNESADCEAHSHSGSFSQLNHLATHPHSGSLPRSAEWNWKSTIALQWGPWIDALSVESCRCTWSLSPSTVRLQRWDQEQQDLILKPKNRLGCLGPQNVLFGQAQIAEFSELDHGFKEKTSLAIYPSIWCALILCFKKKIDKTES